MKIVLEGNVFFEITHETSLANKTLENRNRNESAFEQTFPTMLQKENEQLLSPTRKRLEFPVLFETWLKDAVVVVVGQS
jgi:hypothetical protein